MNSRNTMFLLVAAAMLSSLGCGLQGTHNLPPAHRLMHPGPGVAGPGPGVHPPMMPPPFMDMGGGQGAGNSSAQVAFVSPESMRVRWDTAGAGSFESVPLITPGRHNFPQSGIYRLKLTNVPARDGVELYPTLEIGPTTPRTESFLSHNSIPVQFTEEDFDQVLTGNYVTKVIYLPDPEFQELALAGVETLVSTRLDPGVDPIVEADRRGAILAIVRLGNKDLEMPGIDANAGVAPVGYFPAIGGGNAAFGGGVAPVPPGYVSGVSAMPWGMPITGTPIGLPGPPHIPMGAPAGLQRHTMRNRTKMHLPGPSKKININVKQQPGFSYPMPATNIKVREQLIGPAPNFHQPHGNKFQFIK